MRKSVAKLIKKSVAVDGFKDEYRRAEIKRRKRDWQDLPHTKRFAVRKQMEQAVREDESK
jgi:hypothetical protein